MKSSRWILIFGLIAALAPLSAQAANDWYLGKPISEIRFDGLVTVQKSDLEGVTRPYIGQKFTQDLFQNLQSDLYNLDYFDGLIVPTAVKADDKGSTVILIFKVKEKPIVGEIVFTGNKKVGKGELNGALTIKRGDLINSAKVKNDEDALLKYYHEHGFLDAAVTSSTESIDEHKTKVIFHITEGIQNAVKSITFKGNSFASDSTLRGLMDTKVQGLFNNGLFKEADFTKDLRSIESYYWNHGYLDARVIDVQRNVTFDKKSERNGLDIVISLKEGSPLIFGGFTFEGNHIFNTDTLSALVREPVGKTVNKERLEADYQRVVDLYLENGYIFNSINRKEVREGNKVSYVISIVERPRAHIESIVVRGNTKTKEKVILREIPIAVGDVFSKAKIVDGMRNLYNLQYFSSITPDTPQGSEDGLMDLVFNVEEGKTANISFGLAFSGTTSFPISAQVKWSDSNFLGNGQTVGGSLTASPTQQSLALTFNENWFMDRRITLGGTVGFTHATNALIDQDVQAPTYSDKEIPDPYKDGEYVFSDDKIYNGIQYHAGDLFPGVPSDSDVSTYDLITRYQYDLNNGTVKKNAQMQYDQWQINLGVNTGYSWYTPYGRFGLGTGERTTVQYVTYDSTIYRPANEALRDNLDTWRLSNQWWTKGTWDTRDIVYNPTNGFLLSETLTLTGGFLGGNTHYTRTDSLAEYYFNFFSIPVADNYTIKLVFRARSGFSFLSSSIGGPNAVVVEPTDELYVDGMTTGRGWGIQTGGKSMWFNTLELRTPFPFADKLLWWDTFIDDSVLVDIAADQQHSNPFALDLSTHRMAWGTGLRIISPQFPLALYLAKPFVMSSNGTVTWTKGDGIFGPDIDMKLVVAFSMTY